MAAPSTKTIKALIRESRDTLAQAHQLKTAAFDAKKHPAGVISEHLDHEVIAKLSQFPITHLKELIGVKARWGALEAGGYRTVADIAQSSVLELTSIDGVGDKSAFQLRTATQSLAKEVRQSVQVALDPSHRSAHATEVIRALYKMDRSTQALKTFQRKHQSNVSYLHQLSEEARPAASVWKKLIPFGKGRQEALECATRLQDWILTSTYQDLVAELQVALDDVQEDPTEYELWLDFEADAARYYALLEQFHESPKPSTEAIQGFISREIVERVESLELNQSHLRKVSLRIYQEFGAKFAVVQKRTILGDEMGCGKTLQALAFLSHLHTDTSRHLVVCPASVLVNWEHEILKFTSFRAQRLHGPNKHAELARWNSSGQIAITTFDTLRNLEFSSDRADSQLNVVVDEAHYLKNPNTKRAQAVTALTKHAAHVLFLTGTPMENRVEEFQQLVNYLQPSLLSRLLGGVVFLNSKAFRESVAPVYLRRNQEDVLAELPDRIEVEDWLEFTAKDSEAYFAAVKSGNMMEMRRAAYHSGKQSAKLKRLLEIVNEAATTNQKVVIFSFFHAVLDAAADAISLPVFGPLKGSVSPKDRQSLITDFIKTNGAAVLVSQIQAGGVGLNIQAASVVIVTEPQWKPSAEEQAIARCHRMGQVRTVQVHRLLAARSVDERVRELLAEKIQEFDAYARPSDIKNQSPDAQATHTREALDTVINADTEQHIIQLV